MKFEDCLDTEVHTTNHLFMCYCTFITLTQGKKMNLANIFLLLLKNKNLRNIFKSKMELQSDFEAISFFLKNDTSLYKSKYIVKYLNKAGACKINQ